MLSDAQGPGGAAEDDGGRALVVVRARIRIVEVVEPVLADAVVERVLRVWTDVAGSKVGVRDAARAFVELGLIGRRYHQALGTRRAR